VREEQNDVTELLLMCCVRRSSVTCAFRLIIFAFRQSCGGKFSTTEIARRTSIFNYMLVIRTPAKHIVIKRARAARA
jgi:hypothetical protein